MKNSLTTINEIIKDIEQNLGKNNKLEQLCQKLESTLASVSKDLQYHYNLFLVEIYGTRLQKIKKAHEICKGVMTDERKHVKVEAILRLSSLYSYQHKFEDASASLEKAIKMMRTDQPEISMIITYFFQRLMQSLIDGKILKAYELESKNNFSGAINVYDQQFDCQQTYGSDHNRYFSATSIKRLCDLFPQFTKIVNLKKYDKYLSSLEAQEDEDEYTTIQQGYQSRKKYLSIIIDFMKLQQKKRSHQYEKELCIKKILSIYKLKIALNEMTSIPKGPIEEINKSLKDLQQNRISDPTMLNQFVRKQYAILQKTQKIVDDASKCYYRHFYQHLIKIRKSSFPIFLYPNQEKYPVSSQKIPHTQSFIIDNNIRKFEGSYMIKVNQNSQGSQKRYFYFNFADTFKDKMKLFYTNKQSKASKSDDSYEIKDLKAILIGKKTKALQRKQCNQFQEHLCFSLELKDTFKNFYVPDKESFDNWIEIFQLFVGNKKKGTEKSRTETKMSKSKVVEYDADILGKQMLKSAMKKTKKDVKFA